MAKKKEVFKLPKCPIGKEGIFAKEMTGWLKFQPILAKINNPTEVLHRLSYEMEYSRRPMIIKRLIQKYNKLKAQEVEIYFSEYTQE